MGNGMVAALGQSSVVFVFSTFAKSFGPKRDQPVCFLNVMHEFFGDLLLEKEFRIDPLNRASAFWKS